MSIISASLYSKNIREYWSYIYHYVAPPVSAGIAIIPVFYGLIAKSARQLGTPIPRMKVREIVVESCKAYPTLGVIVGTQMIAQSIFEKVLSKVFPNKQASFTTMFASSAIVGGISAPALAVFNGQTMGRSVVKSLKCFSTRQVVAIMARESTFLFSLRIIIPMSEMMREVFGSRKWIDTSSAFISGAIGSLAGHPADTALTLWQKGIKIKNLSQLMRGGSVKAMSLGGFAVGYKQIREFLMDARAS